MGRLVRYDEDDINALTQGCDALRAENERLRGVMTKIVALKDDYMEVSVDFLFQDAVEFAEQALDEVTK